MPSIITSTIKLTGGDYSSIVAWEAAKQGDITAGGSDQIQQAECYASVVNDAGVAIDGWTTDTTHYLRIYTPIGERHTNKTGTGYMIQSSGFVSAITIAEENVRIEGIAFNTGVFPQTIVDMTASGTCDIRIDDCFLDGSASSSFSAMRAIAGSGTWKISNTTILKSAEYGVNWNPGGGTLYFYNNSLVGCGTLAGGFFGILRTSGTVVAKNNLNDTTTGSGSNAATGGWSGTFDGASTNNHSTDGTGPATNLKSGTPTYVNLAGGDPSLNASDTSCKDQGIDLSADSNLVISDDIVGTSRPQNGTYDIGSFEVITISNILMGDGLN